MTRVKEIKNANENNEICITSKQMPYKRLLNILFKYKTKKTTE